MQSKVHQFLIMPGCFLLAGERRDYRRTNEIRTNVFSSKDCITGTPKWLIYTCMTMCLFSRNSLGIKDENTLDQIEAEQSRANMMLLYERGFHDFAPSGLCEIHHFLFGDLYDWAGKYRIINIEKRERLLAGRSVWYSNDEEIPNDLESAFSALYQPNWDSLNS